MNSYEITFPKHKIDVLPLKFGYYLNVIFNYCEKEYLITKIWNQVNLIKDYRLLCDLQNKNSDFYLEMMKALKILNETSNKYVIWNSLSKKILRQADIFINKQIRIELCQKEAVRYLNSKNKLIPMISIFFM